MKRNKKIALFVATALCISQLFSVVAYTDDIVTNAEETLPTPNLELFTKDNNGVLQKLNPNEKTYYNSKDKSFTVCVPLTNYGDTFKEQTATAKEKFINEKYVKITISDADGKATEIDLKSLEEGKISYNTDYTNCIDINFSHQFSDSIAVDKPHSVEVAVLDPKTATTDKPSYLTADKFDLVVDTIRPNLSLTDDSGKELTPGNAWNELDSNDAVFTLKLMDNLLISNYSIKLNGVDFKKNLTPTDKENEFTFTANDLGGDNVYVLSITATDIAGNDTEDYKYIYNIVKQTKPGTVNVSNLKALSKDPQSFTVTYNNAKYAKAIVEIDGVPFGEEIYSNVSQEFYYDVEGVHTLTVKGYDYNDKVVELLTRNFTLDFTKPSITLNKGIVQDNGFTSLSYSPSYSIKEGYPIAGDSISHFEVMDNNGNAIPVSGSNFAISNEGTYTVVAIAEDNAGNIGRSNPLTFTIDKTNPVAKIDGIINNFYYNKAVQPVATITDKYLASENLTLNNKAFVNGSEIKAEGEHQLSVSGVDKAGNVSNKLSYVFNIDQTKPSITISGVINNSIINEFLKPLIDINENNSLVSMLLNGKEYRGELITADGKYTLVVKVVDKAGNLTEKIISFTLDSTAPKISVSGVENGKYYKNSVTPKVKTYEDSEIVMTLNGEKYNGSAIKKPGKHILVIQATDKANNRTEEIIEFTILEDGQQAPPGREGDPKDRSSKSFFATYQGPLIAGGAVGVIAIFSIVVTVAVKKKH